jgi:hypothetical protein
VPGGGYRGRLVRSGLRLLPGLLRSAILRPALLLTHMLLALGLLHRRLLMPKTRRKLRWL